MFTYETYHKEKLHDDSIMSMLIDANILFTGSCDHSIKLTVIMDLCRIWEIWRNSMSYMPTRQPFLRLL